MPRSQNNELAGGFTHWRIIDHDDVIEAGAADTAVIEAIAVPAGGVVKDVAVYVKKRWISQFETNSEALMTVGDGDNADGYIESYDIYETAASSGVTVWGGGAYFLGTDSAGATTANVVNGKLYSAADTIDVTITVDDSVDKFISGELFIGAVILDPSSYK